MSTENTQAKNIKKENKQADLTTKPKKDAKPHKVTAKTDTNKSTTKKEQEKMVECEPIECRTLVESELYREVHKNTQMAIDSINALKPYIEDKALKNLLNIQLKKYQNLATEIEYVCQKEDCTLEKSNVLDKVFLKGMMFISSLKNDSVSKIAERSIQGTNMGVINISRALNNVSDKVDTSYADKLLGLYNNSIDHLRVYL